MAAHLIQLTAISHLSSEILGLEVNVVRERMFDLTEGLISRGYGDDDIRAILGGNFRRVLGEIWG